MVKQIPFTPRAALLLHLTHVLLVMLAQFGSDASFLVGRQVLLVNLYPFIHETQFPLESIKVQKGTICKHFPKETIYPS